MPDDPEPAPGAAHPRASDRRPPLRDSRSAARPRRPRGAAPQLARDGDPHGQRARSRRVRGRDDRGAAGGSLRPRPRGRPRRARAHGARAPRRRPRPRVRPAHPQGSRTPAGRAAGAGDPQEGLRRPRAAAERPRGDRLARRAAATGPAVVSRARGPRRQQRFGTRLLPARHGLVAGRAVRVGRVGADAARRSHGLEERLGPGRRPAGRAAADQSRLLRARRSVVSVRRQPRQPAVRTGLGRASGTRTLRRGLGRRAAHVRRGDGHREPGRVALALRVAGRGQGSGPTGRLPAAAARGAAVAASVHSPRDRQDSRRAQDRRARPRRSGVAAAAPRRRADLPTPHSRANRAVRGGDLVRVAGAADVADRRRSLGRGADRLGSLQCIRVRPRSAGEPAGSGLPVGVRLDGSRRSRGSPGDRALRRAAGVRRREPDDLGAPRRSAARRVPRSGTRAARRRVSGTTADDGNAPAVSASGRRRRVRRRRVCRAGRGQSLHWSAAGPGAGRLPSTGRRLRGPVRWVRRTRERLRWPGERLRRPRERLRRPGSSDRRGRRFRRADSRDRGRRAEPVRRGRTQPVRRRRGRQRLRAREPLRRGARRAARQQRSARSRRLPDGGRADRRRRRPGRRVGRGPRGRGQAAQRGRRRGRRGPARRQAPQARRTHHRARRHLRQQRRRRRRRRSPAQLASVRRRGPARRAPRRRRVRVQGHLRPSGDCREACRVRRERQGRRAQPQSARGAQGRARAPRLDAERARRRGRDHGAARRGQGPRRPRGGRQDPRGGEERRARRAPQGRRRRDRARQDCTRSRASSERAPGSPSAARKGAGATPRPARRCSTT